MSDTQWIEDGHVLHFRIDRDVISIAYVECPYEDKTAICNRRRTACVVATFVDVYGAEVNVGSASIDGPVEIAWSPTAKGDNEFDDEFSQVWIVPIEDADYIAWKLLEAAEPE